MSADIMPCGCEGHMDNLELCNYPGLSESMDVACVALQKIAKVIEDAGRSPDCESEDGHSVDCCDHALISDVLMHAQQAINFERR